MAENVLHELDLEAIEQEKMYDGFYAVSTNAEEDIEEIIKVNKNRWMIEECFRIMKLIRACFNNIIIYIFI